MNKYLAALVAAIGLVASAFTPASAGLVMTETETMVSGHPGGQPGGQPPQPRERTMMIEGNKQKTIMEGGARDHHRPRQGHDDDHRSGAKGLHRKALPASRYDGPGDGRSRDASR